MSAHPPTDLPFVVLSEGKKEQIFKAIEEIAEMPQEYQLGDVTTENIMEIYNIRRDKARRIMKELVMKHPDRFQQVYIKVPGTYHNRPGYAIRAVLPPIPVESSVA